MTHPRSDDQRESDVWRARLRDFLHDCVSSAAIEETDRLREAIWLLPRSDKPAGSRTAIAIEAMIASGACESAALAMLGPDRTFMLSRGKNGTCLASVVIPEKEEELIAEGATMALALLAGHVSVLLSLLEEAAPAEPPAIRTATSARLH